MKGELMVEDGIGTEDREIWLGIVCLAWVFFDWTGGAVLVPVCPWGNLLGT